MLAGVLSLIYFYGVKTVSNTKTHICLHYIITLNAFYFSVWVNLTIGIIKVSCNHLIYFFFTLSPTLSSFFPFLLLLLCLFLPLCSLFICMLCSVLIFQGLMHASIGVCAPWNWQEAWGDSYVCICVCTHTHAYKNEWTFDVFILSAVYAEDEV